MRALAILVMLSSACTDTVGISRRPVVGLILGAPSSSVGWLFAQQIETGADQESVAQGVTLMVLAPPSNDAGDQIALVRQLGTQSLDALIIDPMDSTILAPPLSEIDARGIPVLTVHRVIGDGEYGAGGPEDFPRTHVGSNDHNGGRIACDLLASRINATGRIYVQTPTPTDARMQGCIEVLGEKYPAMTIAAHDINGQSEEVARQEATDALAADPSIAGILCTDTSSALAVADLAPRQPVVGFDPSTETLDHLADLSMAASLAQKPQSMGRLAVKFAMAAVRRHQILPRLIDPGFVVLDNANAHHLEMAAYVY